ncbi:patatin-like phospholipase family protein [Flavobacteriaceae bacterium MHTCC 0001]
MRSSLKIKILIVILFVFAHLKAQTKVDNDSKPKVGLVLSGGGAKGLAHIGVLKVLDSLNVKVDYVAGTSMGAIVGSLYACGYSGKALDSIFNDLDFDKILSDDLPRASKAFDERNNSERYAITLPFDNFKLKLPSALSKGQNTYNLLSKLMLHVSHIDNFRDLPIPFFCIATNIETGKPVQLESGNLAQAVMASGALPSLFQPVKIGEQILIDGGVVNNYPIDELRAKGMDVIVGVDVQDGLRSKEELSSAPEVLIQINNFRTIKDMKAKSGKTDVYIKPDIKNFTVVSFDEGNQIIANGKQAALENIAALENLKGNPTRHSNKPSKIKAKDSIFIRSIEIKGNKKYTRAYILGKLKLKGQEQIAYTDFVKGINNVVATNNFEAFHYKLRPLEEENSYDLHAHVRESKTTTFIKFGGHFDDLYKSAALINLTKKRLLFNNDIASLDLILGDNVRYNFNYLIDKGFYWGIGLRSRYNQFRKGISVDNTNIDDADLNQVNVLLQDQTNQFYLETLFRKDFALNLGAEHKRLEIKSETIASTDEDAFIFEKTDYFSVFGNLRLDTYDNKYFPKKGVYFNSDVHMYLFASNFNTDFKSFTIGKVHTGYAFSISPKLSFNLQAGVGLKFGDKSTTTLDFAFGGYGNHLINNFIPFYGYDFISITGNSFVKAAASMDYEVFNKHHITLDANWANVDNDIFETPEWFTLPDYRGYALGYAVDSFFGPIQIKYSYSPEREEGEWFFNVGFWF